MPRVSRSGPAARLTTPAPTTSRCGCVSSAPHSAAQPYRISLDVTAPRSCLGAARARGLRRRCGRHNQCGHAFAALPLGIAAPFRAESHAVPVEKRPSGADNSTRTDGMKVRARLARTTARPFGYTAPFQAEPHAARVAERSSGAYDNTRVRDMTIWAQLHPRGGQPLRIAARSPRRITTRRWRREAVAGNQMAASNRTRHHACRQRTCRGLSSPGG